MMCSNMIFLVKDHSNNKKIGEIKYINTQNENLISMHISKTVYYGISEYNQIIQWENKNNEINKTIFILNSNPSFFNTKLKFLNLTINSSVVIAIDDNYDLYVWGNSTQGVLGLGFRITEVTSPTKLKSLFNIVKVSISENHAVALNKEGIAYSWGTGKYGELAIESSVYSSYPCEISKKLYKEVYCKDLITCFIDKYMKFSYFGIINEEGENHSTNLKKLLDNQIHNNTELLFEEKTIVELEDEEFQSISIGNGYIILLSKNGYVFSIDLGDNITVLYSLLPIENIVISNNSLYGLSIVSVKTQKRYLMKWVCTENDKKIDKNWEGYVYELMTNIKKEYNIELINTTSNSDGLFIKVIKNNEENNNISVNVKKLFRFINTYNDSHNIKYKRNNKYIEREKNKGKLKFQFEFEYDNKYENENDYEVDNKLNKTFFNKKTKYEYDNETSFNKTKQRQYKNKANLNKTANGFFSTKNIFSTKKKNSISESQSKDKINRNNEKRQDNFYLNSNDGINFYYDDDKQTIFNNDKLNVHKKLSIPIESSINNLSNIQAYIPNKSRVGDINEPFLTDVDVSIIDNNLNKRNIAGNNLDLLKQKTEKIRESNENLSENLIKPEASSIDSQDLIKIKNISSNDQISKVKVKEYENENKNDEEIIQSNEKKIVLTNKNVPNIKIRKFNKEIQKDLKDISNNKIVDNNDVKNYDITHNINEFSIQNENTKDRTIKKILKSSSNLRQPISNDEIIKNLINYIPESNKDCQEVNKTVSEAYDTINNSSFKLNYPLKIGNNNEIEENNKIDLNNINTKLKNKENLVFEDKKNITFKNQKSGNITMETNEIKDNMKTNIDEYEEKYINIKPIEELTFQQKFFTKKSSNSDLTNQSNIKIEKNDNNLSVFLNSFRRNINSKNESYSKLNNIRYNKDNPYNKLNEEMNIFKNISKIKLFINIIKSVFSNYYQKYKKKSFSLIITHKNEMIRKKIISNREFNYINEPNSFNLRSIFNFVKIIYNKIQSRMLNNMNNNKINFFIKYKRFLYIIKERKRRLEIIILKHSQKEEIKRIYYIKLLNNIKYSHITDFLKIVYKVILFRNNKNSHFFDKLHAASYAKFEYKKRLNNLINVINSVNINDKFIKRNFLYSLYKMLILPKYRNILIKIIKLIKNKIGKEIINKIIQKNTFLIIMNQFINIVNNYIIGLRLKLFSKFILNIKKISKRNKYLRKFLIRRNNKKYFTLIKYFSILKNETFNDKRLLQNITIRKILKIYYFSSKILLYKLFYKWNMTLYKKLFIFDNDYRYKIRNEFKYVSFINSPSNKIIKKKTNRSISKESTGFLNSYSLSKCTSKRKIMSNSTYSPNISSDDFYNISKIDCKFRNESKEKSKIKKKLNEDNQIIWKTNSFNSCFNNDYFLFVEFTSLITKINIIKKSKKSFINTLKRNCFYKKIEIFNYLIGKYIYTILYYNQARLFIKNLKRIGILKEISNNKFLCSIEEKVKNEMVNNNKRYFSKTNNFKSNQKEELKKAVKSNMNVKENIFDIYDNLYVKYRYGFKILLKRFRLKKIYFQLKFFKGLIKKFIELKLNLPTEIE